MKVGPVTIKVGDLAVSAKMKPWAKRAILVSAVACAVADLFSHRLAEWVSEKSAAFIARHGFSLAVTTK